VPTNEQRRQAAKRKLERQLLRRVERAKRRRLIAVVSTVVVTVLAVGGVYLLVTHKNTPAAAAPGSSSTASQPPTSQPPAQTTKGPCAYAQDPTGQAAKNVGPPNDPNPTPNTGTVAVTLKTSQGDIPIALNQAEAPCTVQSFVHLATAKFFDSTPCHRMTTTTGLKVLQCGDPTGKGNGGPGYRFKDETKPGMTYSRGTLAMANSGPNTNGSQFFMVYGDSQLPPNYTVFGTIDAAGLAVLDKVAAGGVTPGQNGPGDGAPVTQVTIQQAVVAN
jgi:peptidyl-prolyl cis-trans isomerase B (cyclophilin B)